MKDQLPFFASVVEQVRWAEALLLDPATWCWAEHGSEYSELKSEMVGEWLARDSGGVLYVGNRALTTAPRWNNTAGGREILDPWESRAVQFLPSIFLPDRGVLLEGRLARAVNPNPNASHLRDELQAFFQDLCKRSRALWGCSPDPFVVDTVTGIERRVSDICISSGARDMWANGARLRQTPDSRMEFSVRIDAKAARSSE